MSATVWTSQLETELKEAVKLAHLGKTAVITLQRHHTATAAQLGVNECVGVS